MENETALLLRNPLFAQIGEKELEALLACLAPVRRHAGRGELLLLCGQESRSVGVLLSGQAEGYRVLPDGTQLTISRMGPGGVFGDVLGGSGLKSPVTVAAKTPCEVLLIPYGRLVSPCARLCPAHRQLVLNLIRTTGRKYFALSDRIELLMQKSLRAKVCIYLLAEAQQAGADTFELPFTRTALAEYLSCDRSALCRELSRMQRDGLIEISKNRFHLTDRPALARRYQNQEGFYASASKTDSVDRDPLLQ